MGEPKMTDYLDNSNKKIKLALSVWVESLRERETPLNLKIRRCFLFAEHIANSLKANLCLNWYKLKIFNNPKNIHYKRLPF